MLDWVNVTAQFENAVDTLEAREMLMREGFAFVHVSAQSAGLCCIPLTPQVYDPVRYAAINHPGDKYANDMLSQIAQALHAPHGGPDPMGGMRSRRSSPRASRSRRRSCTPTSTHRPAQAASSTGS